MSAPVTSASDCGARPSRLHVAMVTPFPDSPDTVPGGVAGVAKYLADEMLARRDVRLSIIQPGRRPGKTTVLQYPGYEVYRLGGGALAHFFYGRCFDLVGGRRMVTALLRELRPDVVHYHAFAYLARACPYPNVVTIHGIAEREVLFRGSRPAQWLRWVDARLLEGIAREKADRVITISRYTERFLGSQRNGRRVWLVENPVARRFFASTWSPQPGTILCCSKIIPLKNIHGMLIAFREIRRRCPDAQLRVAGHPDGEYAVRCRATAEELGLADAVHWLGQLDVAGVQREMMAANCLAVPSFQENAPLCIGEAMAVGVPVVGARVGGIPEMVTHGETGFLVDPADAGSIAGAVIDILTNPECAQRMSQRAREQALERFYPSIAVDKTWSIYQQLLSSTPLERGDSGASAGRKGLSPCGD